MGLHRVQVPGLAAELVLGPQATRHLHVLRLRPGDRVQVFDGQGGQAEATVETLEEARAVLALVSGTGAQDTRETPQPVTLAVALLKGDKLADVIRAATELGAARIQLLTTRHADAREIGAQKLVRLRRIAGEAARQSLRAHVPEVLDPLPLTELGWEGTLAFAHPGSAARLGDLLIWDAPLTVLSGPEGGLAEAEVAHLLARGAHAVTLGPRILRAETAPLALLGAVAATGV
ncbi:16S rRNA (uracil1498-N3)-methyltransferase [Deinococcus reticulitermitis]|uniref:Ribosomal RNA small subunit methyltransferase E n=1 Tax=Deinococcus reticulitermitis TaxID=856736 RepID=A0A1H7ARB9_9DEIO|nr:16S rRNA (uracil(1498)-N(3))-methyltransferase [Deinococcus reticulitermitis]SEJ67486.1 16S rRNA (uracil1498-N3)-methyltransferase [Deinococcus reticulitermitis]